MLRLQNGFERLGGDAASCQRFSSHTGEKTRSLVGRIFDRLANHYGRSNIFRDIESMPLGVDYRTHLRSTIQSSDIVLAVIGSQWLSVQNERGRPRITDTGDWVRIELEAALAKGIPVIPLCVDRVPMPKESELPKGVREFAFRHSTCIDSGIDFQSHMDRLISSMDQQLGLNRPVLPEVNFAAVPVSVEDEMMRERAAGYSNWLRSATQTIGFGHKGSGQGAAPVDLAMGVLWT